MPGIPPDKSLPGFNNSVIKFLAFCKTTNGMWLEPVIRKAHGLNGRYHPKPEPSLLGNSSKNPAEIFRRMDGFHRSADRGRIEDETTRGLTFHHS